MCFKAVWGSSIKLNGTKAKVVKVSRQPVGKNKGNVFNMNTTERIPSISQGNLWLLWKWSGGLNYVFCWSSQPINKIESQPQRILLENLNVPLKQVNNWGGVVYGVWRWGVLTCGRKLHLLFFRRIFSIFRKANICWRAKLFWEQKWVKLQESGQMQKLTLFF